MHAPYHHHKALDFCKNVQELYQIPEENIFSVGDFEDNFFLGAYPKGSDFPHTPNQELELARKIIKEWAKAFPLLHMCHSNHASRYYRKAAGGELPTQVLRSYKELFRYPSGWDVEECFVPNVKKPFMVCHGEEFSGINAARSHALAYGISVAHGHSHSSAGVQYINTKTQDLWGMNVGCLIDDEQYCFAYAKHARNKVSLGVGVVLDSGRFPFFVPLNP